MEIIYNIENFPYDKLRIDGEMSTRTRKRKVTYLGLFGAYDIETTTILTPEFIAWQHTDERRRKPLADEYKPYAFMYVWQVAFSNGLVCFGRRWEELQDFIEKIKEVLGLTPWKRLVLYIHNASFEFQFTRNFFNVSEVFATDKRKVVKFLINECIECRCSYRLSNMSLAKFIENTPNAKHGKLDGDEFDYRKVRTPDTVLSEYEKQYCANDVLGLIEAVQHILDTDIYNLATMPMTSTGFVRNEARKRMQAEPKNRQTFLRMALTPEMYAFTRHLSRGGNCHANPTHSNIVLYNGRSKDMSSAYPAYETQGKFPMGKWLPIAKPNHAFERYLYDPNIACMFLITLSNLQIRTMSTIPYIAKAKVMQIRGCRGDNGRVLSADSVTMILADIDFQIIASQYRFVVDNVDKMWITNYDYLPIEYRQYITEMYHEKCELKFGDEYQYNKYKNRINATFGMMLTDICQTDIDYTPLLNEPFTPMKEDPKITLEKYYKNRNSFLSYQWGAWVTLGCRKRLQDAIDGLGSDIFYCDTDSVKFLTNHGDHEELFEMLNAQIRDEARVCGVQTWYETHGRKFELGIWEDDGEYETFKTMGAKKYAYTDPEKSLKKDKDADTIYITVAGLSKKDGAEYLNAHGKMNAFKTGTKIPEGKSGRTVAEYIDVQEPYEITVNGCTFTTASNIAIYDTSYTFGITDEYAELLDELAVLC